MISVNQIREQLVSYLANELPFSQFEDWLLAQSWNMHQHSSSEAQLLVHEIKSPIYEYLDGYIDENSLRARLRPHVQQYRAVGHFGVMSEAPRFLPSSSSPAEASRMEYVA